jgi:hypothetical protein
LIEEREQQEKHDAEIRGLQAPMRKKRRRIIWACITAVLVALVLWNRHEHKTFTAYQDGWDYIAQVPVGTDMQLFTSPGNCLSIYNADDGWYSPPGSPEGYQPKENETQWLAGCNAAVKAAIVVNAEYGPAATIPMK